MLPILLIGDEYPAALVRLIDGANLEIKIVMFDWRIYFTDISSGTSLITRSLIAAVKRGVSVEVLTNHLSTVSALNKNCIKAKKWTRKNLLHAKVVVLDDKIAVVGSHNFTQNGMHHNIEISAVIHDSDFARKFSEYFKKLCPL